MDCEECYAIGISWWHDFSQNSISFRGWDNVSFTLITSFFCIGWSLCWNISILMTIMRKWEVYKLKCNCPISRATLMWCDWCQHVLFLDCRKKDLIKKNYNFNIWINLINEIKEDLKISAQCMKWKGRVPINSLC